MHYLLNLDYLLNLYDLCPHGHLFAFWLKDRKDEKDGKDAKETICKENPGESSRFPWIRAARIFFWIPVPDIGTGYKP